MSRTLDGTVALVTGGSRGIGAAIALRLAEDGADVVLTYQRSAEQAAGVVDRITALGRRALAVRADGGDPAEVTEAVERTVAEFGRLDILVNNAAVFVVGPLDDLSLEDVDRTLHVNVRAVFVASQAAARHMTDGGRIISIGSNVIERTPFAGMALYSMSKAALVGMTKGLAQDLSPRGITVNLVSPGPIDTDMNPADGPNASAINELVPLGRFGTPDDVAATVSHLAGDAGRFITAASVAIDGGITA